MQSNRETIGKLVLTAVLIAIVAAAFLVVQRYGGTPTPIAAAHPKPAPTTRPVTAPRAFKVLHVMSFHTPWEWTESQLKGFKDPLSDLNVEYKVYEMDAKRQSSKEHLQQAGEEARQLIDQWKPDLVFADDDPAQQNVGVYYVNQNLPWVFCGVNADPQDYGYVGARSVTGVLEREHFLETVRLLKQIVPTVHRIAIITDTAPMWQRVINRIKASQGEVPGVEVVSYDVVNTFEDYKRLVKSYEGQVDALGFLGIFEFKGEDGKNVPYQDVCRWTAENSTLPDFSFWVDRVDYGTLCAVTVSAVNQGQEAGKIAREILLNKREPSTFPMLPTVKGEPVINLARARQLGPVPSSEVLLTARVFTDYKWNR
ncbi:MAG: hypothetical protein MUP47_05865 [Phycisphaerae bacterium]|nr:hypothetical protein [Phycisphaerae bacterium]